MRLQPLSSILALIIRKFSCCFSPIIKEESRLRNPRCAGGKEFCSGCYVVSRLSFFLPVGLEAPGSDCIQFRSKSETQVAGQMGTVTDKTIGTSVLPCTERRTWWWPFIKCVNDTIDCHNSSLVWKNCARGSGFWPFCIGLREIGIWLCVGQVVREIQHSRNGVTVVTEDGCIYEANYLILSVSIGVLKSDLISFQPSLPVFSPLLFFCFFFSI